MDEIPPFLQDRRALRALAAPFSMLAKNLRHLFLCWVMGARGHCSITHTKRALVIPLSCYAIRQTDFAIGAEMPCSLRTSPINRSRRSTASTSGGTLCRTCKSTLSASSNTSSRCLSMTRQCNGKARVSWNSHLNQRVVGPCTRMKAPKLISKSSSTAGLSVSGAKHQLCRGRQVRTKGFRGLRRGFESVSTRLRMSSRHRKSTPRNGRHGYQRLQCFAPAAFAPSESRHA